MNSRQEILERQRQESLAAWYASNKGINEARTINSNNAAGLGINGVGGGGSSVTSTAVHNLWVLYYDNSNDWFYTQFSDEKQEWSEDVPLGINGEWNVEWGMTTGYGTGFEFNNGSNIVKHLYFSKDGELIWKQEYNNANDWDIDSENAIGLVSFYVDLPGQLFEITTFYKDVKQTFTFDNYQGNTSFSMNGRLYDNKALYTFGDSGDDNVVLYALDLETGEKTALYTAGAGRYINYNTWSAPTSPDNHIYSSLNAILVFCRDGNTGETPDIKIIDFNGNVIQDIAAQAQALGTPVEGAELYDWGAFGRCETTKDLADAVLWIKLYDGPYLYGGCTNGLVWSGTVDDGGGIGFLSYNQYQQNNFIAFSTAGEWSNIVDIYYYDTNTSGDEFNCLTVSQSGVVSNTPIFSWSGNILQIGDTLNFWSLVSDDNLKPLSLTTINVETGEWELTTVGAEIWDTDTLASNQQIVHYSYAYPGTRELLCYLHDPTRNEGDGQSVLYYLNDISNTPDPVVIWEDTKTIEIQTSQIWTGLLPTIFWDKPTGTDEGEWNIYKIIAPSQTTDLVRTVMDQQPNVGGYLQSWDQKRVNDAWVITASLTHDVTVLKSTEQFDFQVANIGTPVSYGAVCGDGIVIRYDTGTASLYTQNGVLKGTLFPIDGEYINQWSDNLWSYLTEGGTATLRVFYNNAQYNKTINNLGSIEVFNYNDYWSY